MSLPTSYDKDRVSSYKSADFINFMKKNGKPCVCCSVGEIFSDYVKNLKATKDIASKRKIMLSMEAIVLKTLSRFYQQAIKCDEPLSFDKPVSELHPSILNIITIFHADWINIHKKKLEDFMKMTLDEIFAMSKGIGGSYVGHFALVMLIQLRREADVTTIDTTAIITT